MYYGVWRPSMRMAEENQDNVNTCTWNRYWGTFSGIFAGVGAGLLISELVDETTSPQPAYFAGGGALVGLVGGFVIDKITKGRGNPCGCCVKVLGCLAGFIPLAVWAFLDYGEPKTE